MKYPNSNQGLIIIFNFIKKMSSPNDISLKDIPTEYVLNKFSTDSDFMEFANGIIITNFRIDRYRREKK